MKSTGLAIGSGLWETVGMGKKIKVGDLVFRQNSLVTYVVTGSDAKGRTADIKNTKGNIIGLKRDVPWSELVILDESQNALRVVREATEQK